MQRRLVVLAITATLGAALAGPATANAANRCHTLAGKGKVVAQSTTTVVYSTGTRENFTLYVYACQFKTQKSLRLPGQNGGGSDTLSTFRLTGRYLAWVSTNAEEASTQVQDSVYVHDLKTRRTIVREYAGLDALSNSSAEVTALVLNTKGSVGWITRGTGDVTDNSVHSVAPGGQVAVLDRGSDVRLRSLALSSDGARLYWTRGDAVKSSAAAARR